MIRQALLTLAIAAVAVAAIPPPPAQAGWLDVLRNCSANGQLGKAFTRGDLEQALERMPADLAEYSDCDEQIASSLRGMIGASRLSARAERESESGDGAGGDARSGGEGSGVGPAGGGPEGGAPRSGDVPPRDPDKGVAGSLLSGAEAIGTAPLDVVEAAAEGRLGLPGWLWPLLLVAGLIGVGAARERRA